MKDQRAFFCISGPDKGKRVVLTEQTVLLGRASSCGLLSEDAELGGGRVALALRDGVLRFRASADAKVFVDGLPQSKGTLLVGQQLRAGRSFWQFGEASGAARKAGGLFDQFGHALHSAIGLEQAPGVKVKEVFSSVAKERGEHDLTEFFTVGTSRNTPGLMEIETDWPKPWVFFKALVLTVLVYLGFVFAYKQFANLNLIPGLIMIGASAIPLTVVIFYFEMNAPRNVSLPKVVWLVLVGGIVSLVTSLFGFEMFDQSLGWLGASSAGIIEETGKLLALLIVVNQFRYRWTLNGLLFGGAVGAGFALFESAGYAFRSGLVDYTKYTLGLAPAGLEGVFESIWVRGLLAPGGHVAWTALVGAALWRVRGEREFSLSMLKDERFLRVLALSMGLHMVWNSPLELPFYGKYLVLCAVAWTAIFGFIQDGLNQIKYEQAQAAAAGGEGMI